MHDADPRTGLSRELLPSHAATALGALDQHHIIIAPGDSPAAALTAAAVLVLVARTHAHVDIAHDAPLPRNPWGAATIADLLNSLAPIRPAARNEPQTGADSPVEDTGVEDTDLEGTHGTRFVKTVISTGIHPDADRYLAPSTWTVALTDDLETHLAHLEQTKLSDDPAAAPYGGLFAATVAAADLFCESLAPLGLIADTRRPTFVWNLLDYTYAPAQATSAASTAPMWPAVLFAGCGSVGSSAAAALACDDLTGMEAVTVDGDDFDSAKNPYRYPAALGHENGSKAAWVADLLTTAGAHATPNAGPVRAWTRSQTAPGFNGIAVASVDTVDGRYEVADILAQTTFSAAVHALSFHIQREHLGDGLRCPFCDFVSLATPLAQAAADAVLTGLEEQRIVALTFNGTGLEQHDLDQMVAAGKLTAEATEALLGARIADLRRRLYAQAAIPPAVPDSAPPAALSAPFVSWAVGVLLAAEVAKNARGLAAVDRRVEVDLHGYPADFVHRYPADASGRCACARAVRRRWMRDLYGDESTTIYDGKASDLEAS